MNKVSKDLGAVTAYAIAVEDGFKGTRSEWLESLKGKDGRDGADGADGAPGTDGKPGADGTPGADGKTPKLTIGTVTTGTTPSASITGEVEDLKLNLVLPDGQGTTYTHPTHTPHASGLYKVTVDELGHVTDAVAAKKEDITALGVPGQDTTYGVFGGATAAAAGSSGLVPAPGSENAGKYLKGDGTWSTPPGTEYDDATEESHGLMTAADYTKLKGVEAEANKTVVDGRVKFAGTNSVSGLAVYLATERYCMATFKADEWETYENDPTMYKQRKRVAILDFYPNNDSTSLGIGSTVVATDYPIVQKIEAPMVAQTLNFDTNRKLQAGLRCIKRGGWLMDYYSYTSDGVRREMYIQIVTKYKPNCDLPLYFRMR